MAIQKDKVLAEFLKLRETSQASALNFLMHHYGDSLTGVVSRILQREDLVEDALQDGFVKIWKNMDNYNPDISSLFTWMLTLVRNSAIDILRKDRKHKNQSIESGVYDSMKYSEEMNLVDSGLLQKLNQLDPKYKQLLDLVYFKGYTQQELSEELQLPLGTIKTRISTGLKMLRKILSNIITIFFR